MGKLFILFSLFLFMGFSAQAGTDIECIEGDCLVYGWEAFDMKSGNGTTVECKNLDCEREGWVSIYKSQVQAEVRCKPLGCFQNGWRVFDVKTGSMLAEVSCFRGFTGQSDCLSHGWETNDRTYGRFITQCILGDCRFRGWETRAQGYQPQRSECKTGGCFIEGWTIRP